MLEDTAICKHDFSPVVKAWQRRLSTGGYETPSLSLPIRMRIVFLSRTWRRILRFTGYRLNQRLSVLEFGCGGGHQLIPLYANGWHCTGVDCSKEVIDRAKEYLCRIEKDGLIRNAAGKINLVHDDFLNFTSDSQFDMTFQFGVVEHYLNRDERLRYLRKMAAMTRKGGFVVNCVPNGEHLLRDEQRTFGLGGYDIPEIDYTTDSLKAEMQECGAVSVNVLPHDLMGYLKIRRTCNIRRIVDMCIYLIWQVPLSQKLPLYVRRRRAYWLIGIGRV